MPDKKMQLTKELTTAAGVAPTYVELRDDGFTAFFVDEIAALRVAYRYRMKKVTCSHRPALGVWSVTVKAR